MIETSTETEESASGPLAVLRRIRDAPRQPARLPGERCELCAEVIDGRHGHLVDLEQRTLLCACRGCYLLFLPGGAGGHRFRAVPERYVELVDFTLSPSQWEALQIPVSVAFFFLNSTLDRVAAFYPSPAGATESLLSLEAWQEIAATSAELSAMTPDVEAFLIRAERGTRPACFIVPIDACYELVGLLRATWRGFDGGQEARDDLDAFFAKVRTRAARP